MLEMEGIIGHHNMRTTDLFSTYSTTNPCCMSTAHTLAAYSLIFEDEGRRGKFVLAGTSTTTGVFANADRALEDIGFTAVVADFGMVVGA